MFFVWLCLFLNLQDCGGKALQSKQTSEPENFIHGKRKLVITLYGEIVYQCYILVVKFRQQRCNISYSYFILLELVNSFNKLPVLYAVFSMGA